MRTLQTEQEIKNSILQFISFNPRCGFAWAQYNGAIFDKQLGIYRKPSRFYRKGVSDILGIWAGKMLVLEVKKPGGKVSPEQASFIEDAKRHGAIAAIVYSLEDAINVLRPHMGTRLL